MRHRAGGRRCSSPHCKPMCSPRRVHSRRDAAKGAGSNAAAAWPAPWRQQQQLLCESCCDSTMMWRVPPSGTLRMSASSSSRGGDNGGSEGVREGSARRAHFQPLSPHAARPRAHGHQRTQVPCLCPHPQRVLRNLTTAAWHATPQATPPIQIAPTPAGLPPPGQGAQCCSPAWPGAPCVPWPRSRCCCAVRVS